MEYAILALSLISAALTVALFIALSKYRRALRIIERMPKFFQTLNRATDEQTDDIIDEVRALRGDMAQQSHLTIQTLEQRIGSFAEQQTRQNEQSEARLRETLAATEQRQAQLERTVAASLERIRSDNEQRLEQMRQTVDERLTSTLSKRLDASFEQVGAQLKQVYTGLGEMQRLAGDLGDFKRVLTNVKARGTWAEVQLGALLEQVLAPNQYEKNACVVPGSLERVEYAIVLPGDDSGPVKLPIDSKFPQEDYLRIVEAGERADAAQMEAATNALKRRLLSEAQKISDKYIHPPATTDFAIMFLPTEGLYSEAMRMDGLGEMLQTQYRVLVAGPSTLCALLSSLRVGFQTLAIQQRSSEVWQLLGKVKSQYADFTALLERTRAKLSEASGAIDRAEQRSRAIQKSLSNVERMDTPMPSGRFDDEE
ncbi:MAG: DNA recombination protein RmuC [Clostridiales bacterium]|nr:DNA recombination protein RmuC [Clostridiales bacterium]MDY4199062.1 DNA recombination protein RmuC [Candidatus Fimadaptatus sp.]